MGLARPPRVAQIRKPRSRIAGFAHVALYDLARDRLPCIGARGSGTASRTTITTKKRPKAKNGTKTQPSARDGAFRSDATPTPSSSQTFRQSELNSPKASQAFQAPSHRQPPWSIPASIRAAAGTRRRYQEVHRGPAALPGAPAPKLAICVASGVNFRSKSYLPVRRFDSQRACPGHCSARRSSSGRW